MDLRRSGQDRQNRAESVLMAKILILNGPNLNLLGKREPEHYGQANLESINQNLVNLGKELKHEIISYQSNAEHELIGQIQTTPEQKINFIIINPAGFTHTSVALRDAFLAAKIPFIEIHLSNIYKRESFRHHSYFSDIAIGVISGLGPIGYELALRAAHHYLQR